MVSLLTFLVIAVAAAKLAGALSVWIGPRPPCGVGRVGRGDVHLRADRLRPGCE